MQLPAYAELHCLSNFSFLRGASHPEELVERAQAQGYVALAITDECSFSGIVRAHEAAKKTGLRLIVGSEIQITDAMLKMLATQSFTALRHSGRTYDCGSPVGFLMANLALGLARDDIGPELRSEIAKLMR